MRRHELTERTVCRVGRLAALGRVPFDVRDSDAGIATGGGSIDERERGRNRELNDSPR
jgi:hypothetical protein